MEEVFTLRQAADYLKISVRSLRELCQQRRIDYSQVTRRKRHFTRQQLEDYLAEVTVPARKRRVDRTALTPLPSPERGGEKKPSLQEDSRKGFSDIRKELSAL